jgi:hypothetical protein
MAVFNERETAAFRVIGQAVLSARIEYEGVTDILYEEIDGSMMIVGLRRFGITLKFVPDDPGEGCVTIMAWSQIGTRFHSFSDHSLDPSGEMDRLAGFVRDCMTRLL